MAKRKSKRNKILTVIIVIAVLIIVVALLFTYYLSKGSKPLDPNNTQVISVTIPQGAGTSSIGNILEEKGIIDSAGNFKMQSRIKGYDGKYKAGEFALSPGMPMDEIMNIIISGNAATQRFTIPEGYDIRRVVDKLSSEGLINEEIFLKELELGVSNTNFYKVRQQAIGWRVFIP